MPTVIGGKLKLKGDKSKKRNKKRQRENDELRQEGKEERKEEVKGQEGGEEDDAEAQLFTEAQRKHLKKLREAEERDFKKNALKTYRQRVEELNTTLSKMTEHNDIPRVSAAGNG